MAEHVAIKGARGGLRVVVDDTCSWDDAFAAIQYQLSHGANLFQGMSVSFDMGARAIDSTEMQSFYTVLQTYQLTTADIQADSSEVRQFARAVGLTAKPRSIAHINTVTPVAPAPILIKNLRSGQVHKHLHGDLTLLGDVNAGAELIVAGRFVHAGALGDRNAIICAIELAATQIRIADVRARAPENDAHRNPEIACIEDGQIIVHSWEEYRR
jgi:septum site-determining protein MinC